MYKTKRIVLSFCLIPVSLAVSAQNKKLHNRIMYPEQWSPRYEEPATMQDMPVPYLKEKPTVIPVNLDRQPFVDDFLIAETDLQPIYHTPNFYPQSPVLELDEEWGNTAGGTPCAAPFNDGIWYNEEDSRFKMWYLAGADSIHKQDKQTFYIGYVESEDGKHWVRPKLDIYNQTSIVDACSRDATTIWLDGLEKDPAERYKTFNVERRPTDHRWQFILKYSAGDIHWSSGAMQSGNLYDRSSAFYNPFRGVQASSMRYSTSVSSCFRSYLENVDPEVAVGMAHRIHKGIPDKNMYFWFMPNDKEPRHPQFPEVDPGVYNFDAIAYESIMLELYSIWQGPENNVCTKLGIQKKNEIFLGYSRDGFHFSRSPFRPFMAVNEARGAWNWGNIRPVNRVPLVAGDSLYFYSNGHRLNNIMWDDYTSTGLAALRRDGFVSMQAGETKDYLVTERLTFGGKYLFVNVDVHNKKGALAMGVLDEDDNPIPGYTKKEYVARKKVNNTRQTVIRKDAKDLSVLSGKTIRLRFYVTNGDLYSFWISPWETGKNRGYTVGGGPELFPEGVDKPIR